MILELALTALLQVPAVVNPSKVLFVCPDHDQDTQHRE
jgi:hypothetical protein